MGEMPTHLTLRRRGRLHKDEDGDMIGPTWLSEKKRLKLSRRNERVLTFCFRRLQDSQAWAVRIRLSSGTFGLVILRGLPQPTIGSGNCQRRDTPALHGPPGQGTRGHVKLNLVGRGPSQSLGLRFFREGGEGGRGADASAELMQTTGPVKLRTHARSRQDRVKAGRRHGAV